MYVEGVDGLLLILLLLLLLSLLPLTEMISNRLKHIAIGSIPREEELARGGKHCKRSPQTGVPVEQTARRPVLGGGEDDVHGFT